MKEIQRNRIYKFLDRSSNVRM